MDRVAFTLRRQAPRTRRARRLLAAGAAFLCVGAAVALPLVKPTTVSARGFEPASPAGAATQTVSMPSFAPVQAPAPQGSPALAAIIEQMGAQFAGHVGIAVQSVDQGWAVSFNGNDLFPQQSVSKLWVAMTMFDAIDRGKLTLSTPVMIRSEDLTLFHQPLAAMVRGEGYQTTLSDLFTRAMTQSDNTANDSVLRTVGGPDAVRAFLARRFVSNVRFGPGERLLQSQTAGITWTQDLAFGRKFEAVRARMSLAARQKALDDYVANPIDGAAPLAIVGALAKLKRGQMLSPTSTALLMETMGEAHTGPNRIKAGVPAGWHYLHKTGTGQELGARQAGYNDVGIMTAPDGSSYAIAVMIGDTRLPIPKRWELMQGVARAVAALHQPLGSGTIASSVSSGASWQR